MAQVTVDKVCEKLHVERQCRTHFETLPSLGEQDHHGHYLGARLQKIEQDASYGQLVCECELVTQAEVERSIVQTDAQTIDDIRRDVRLGMGPCQGAFCAFRATGMLHALRHPPVELTNMSLRDFLQERWKGDLPVLWGQQLRQERFNELVYIDVLNAPDLPGGRGSNLAPNEYAIPSEQSVQKPPDNYLRQNMQTTQRHMAHPQDVIVIGAGLAGLVTGWRTCMSGLKTTVITKGWGATYWGSGCIDLAGYQAPDYSTRVDSPRNYLDSFIKAHPDHPYAMVGLDVIDQAVQSFLQLSTAGDYPFYGSLDKNFILPTALGTLRPTCLAPLSMLAGEASIHSPMLIVGFSQFLDFHPTLVADNLNAQGFLTKDISLDLKSLKSLKFITGMVLARMFDDPEFRLEIIEALKPSLGSAGRVGFPAVLGLSRCPEAIKHLESSLGVPVFEIPGLPPSIPGIRLHNLLLSAIQGLGGFVYNGMTVSAASTDDHKVTEVGSEAAARRVSHRAKSFVFATGGFLGGGIIAQYDGNAQDAIFNLPIETPLPRSSWFQGEFLSSGSHPIYTSGIKIDQGFRPVDTLGQVIWQNLYTAGSLLANCDPIRERSLEGIALATGFKLGKSLSAGGTR
jgi:glycerol-3-phosphate dehydrogenase subunit B